MNASEKIALSALVASLFAAGVSLVTLWCSHLARFRSVTTVGHLRHSVYTIESEGSRWHVSSFDLPVTVTNGGARIGQVLGLRLRLSFPDVPIPGNCEILPAKFEIPPSEARLISADRLTWLDQLEIIDWLPYTVLPGACQGKHFVFETRWDEPVVQKRMLARLEMLTSRDSEWHVVARFEMCLSKGTWAEMVHGGSSFSYAPEDAFEQDELVNPPDLHGYTGTKEEIPAESIAPASRLVPPRGRSSA